MIYVGIDMHPYNMTLAAVNDNGDFICEEKICCKTDELLRFFDRFDRPIQAVVESTSSWYWLNDWCLENRIPLLLAHSKMVKAISYAKVKTDSVDARTLAELLRVGLIPEAWKTKKHRRDLRELTRGRIRLIRRRTMIQNQVYSLCSKYNVSINEVSWYHLHQMEDHLLNHLPQMACIEAEQAIDELRLIQRHIQDLEAAIERQIWFTEELERLLQIPGVGLVSAWTILAEIGDINRFPSDKQFASYCRLVPGSNNSGGKHRHKSRNKDGNSYLKAVFMQAGVSASRRYAPVRSYYNKIKKRSGPYVARNVVAKQLSRIVWHMLVRGEPYRGFKGQPTPVKTRFAWPRPISPESQTGTQSPSV